MTLQATLDPNVSHDFASIFDVLLTASACEAPTFSDWWQATRTQRSAQPTSVERALVAGVLASNLGYAFGGGYQEALKALLPARLRDETLGALCITEQGGGHPRAILSRLARDQDDQGLAWRLTGEKTFITLGVEAQRLVVAASRGVNAQGLNDIVLVCVDPAQAGVEVQPMPSLGMVPEILHAQLRLERVKISADALLEGDGYTTYIKPFRTVEDIHVHAAVSGYLLGCARRLRWAQGLQEHLLAGAASLRGLAHCSPHAPSTHIALAGILAQQARLLEDVDTCFNAAGGQDAACWLRDRPLLSIAARARQQRRDVAWTSLQQA